MVPVLVDGAVLPRADDLPLSLRPLIRRQAFELSHGGFRTEVTSLLAAVGLVFEAEQGRSAKNYVEEGDRLSNQGLFNDAETAYRIALDLAPALAPAHLGLGDVLLYGLERYSEAEARDSSKSLRVFSLVTGPGGRASEAPDGGLVRCGGFPRRTWLLRVCGRG